MFRLILLHLVESTVVENDAARLCSGQRRARHQESIARGASRTVLAHDARVHRHVRQFAEPAPVHGLEAERLAGHDHRSVDLVGRMAFQSGDFRGSFVTPRWWINLFS